MKKKNCVKQIKKNIFCNNKTQQENSVERIEKGKGKIKSNTQTRKQKQKSQ